MGLGCGLLEEPGDALGGLRLPRVAALEQRERRRREAHLRRDLAEGDAEGFAGRAERLRRPATSLDQLALDAPNLGYMDSRANVWHIRGVLCGYETNRTAYPVRFTDLKMLQAAECVKPPLYGFHVAPCPTFAERLAYARFLHHLLTGEAPSNAAIARAAGRANAWVTEVVRRDEAPTDYRVHRPIAELLGVGEAWLFRGEGGPPEPDLWARWLEQRTAEKWLSSERGAETTAPRRTAAESEGGIPAPRRSAAEREAEAAAKRRRRGA